MRMPLASRATSGTEVPGPSTTFDRFLDSGLLLVIESAALALMTLSVVTRTWQDRMWLGFVLVGVTALAWSPELFRVRFRRWWFAYVAGIFVYTLLRAFADETFIPIQVDYVIHADRWLFFGYDPVPWLQGKAFNRDHIDLLDYGAVGVHWSFFVAPHAMAVAIFLFRRSRFRDYTLIVVGTMYLGLLLFFLVPTTPPWLAGSQGVLEGAYRVMDYVGGEVHGEAYNSIYASVGEPNSVAAMPSIHMGVTFAMYLWAREHYRRAQWWLFGYSILMGLALVYMAEHYVLDVLAGIACAILAFVAAKWLLSRGPLLERSPAKG